MFQQYYQTSQNAFLYVGINGDIHIRYLGDVSIFDMMHKLGWLLLNEEKAVLLGVVEYDNQQWNCVDSLVVRITEELLDISKKIDTVREMYKMKEGMYICIYISLL